MNRPLLNALYWVAVGFMAGAVAMLVATHFLQRSNDGEDVQTNSTP